MYLNLNDRQERTWYVNTALSTFAIVVIIASRPGRQYFVILP